MNNRHKKTILSILSVFLVLTLFNFVSAFGGYCFQQSPLSSVTCGAYNLTQNGSISSEGSWWGLSNIFDSNSATWAECQSESYCLANYVYAVPSWLFNNGMSINVRDYRGGLYSSYIPSACKNFALFNFSLDLTQSFNPGAVVNGTMQNYTYTHVYSCKSSLPVYSLTQSFIYDLNAGEDINGQYWNAQTFIVNSSNYIPEIISLPLLRYGSIGTTTLSIRAVDFYGKPTGADIFSSSLPESSISTNKSWVNFTLSPNATLIKGQKYAIVLRISGSGGGKALAWYGNIGDTETNYASGDYYESVDSGLNWSSFAPNDLDFRIYGNVSSSEQIYSFTTSWPTPQAKIYEVTIGWAYPSCTDLGTCQPTYFADDTHIKLDTRTYYSITGQPNSDSSTPLSSAEIATKKYAWLSSPFVIIILLIVIGVGVLFNKWGGK